MCGELWSEEADFGFSSKSSSCHQNTRRSRAFLQWDPIYLEESRHPRISARVKQNILQSNGCSRVIYNVWQIEKVNKITTTQITAKEYRNI